MRLRQVFETRDMELEGSIVDQDIDAAERL